MQNPNSAWSPARRRAQREQSKRLWADPDFRESALRNRTLGVVAAALKRDPSIAEEITAMVASAEDGS